MHDSQSLHEAVWKGSLSEVNKFLGQGVDVNAKDECGETPLYEAARWGNPAIVQALLAEGADVNVKDRAGNPPLHEAALQGHDKVVKLLLAADADVNAKDQYVRTPLHEAAYKGHDKVVRLLIEKNAEVNAKDDSAATPLHDAASQGHVEVVELLLEKNAEVNAKNHHSITPLHYAAVNHHIEVVAVLVNKGADLYLISDSARDVLERQISNPAELIKDDYKNICKHFSIYRTAKSIRSLMYGVLSTGLLSALYCFRNNINWLANIAGKYLLSLPILTGSISIMFVAMNAYKASGFKTEGLSVSKMIKKGCGLAFGIKPDFS